MRIAPSCASLYVWATVNVSKSFPATIISMVSVKAEFKLTCAEGFLIFLGTNPAGTSLSMFSLSKSFATLAPVSPQVLWISSLLIGSSDAAHKRWPLRM